MATAFLCLFILLIISHIPKSFSQQNIQTFYPFSPPPLPSIVPPLSPDLPSVLPPPTAAIPPPRRSSTKAAVGRAIGVTAASTVVLSGLLLFLFLRYSKRKREENPSAVAAAAAAAPNARTNGVAPSNSFTRYGGNVKGLIVDENGLDVLYWRNLQEGENRTSFKKQHFKSLREEQQEEEKRIVSERERERKSKPPVQEVPLLRGESSTSQSPIWAEQKDDQIIDKAPSFSNGINAVKVEKQVSSVKLMQNGPPPLPPPPGAPWLQPSRLSAAVPQEKTPSAAPPQPQAAVGAVPNGKTPPPPPPIPSNKGPAPPPPPSVASSMKPPPPNKRSSSAGESSSSEKVKLKPLHWDKVNPNVEHSMVWDKIDKGSFK